MLLLNPLRVAALLVYPYCINISQFFHIATVLASIPRIVLLLCSLFEIFFYVFPLPGVEMYPNIISISVRYCTPCIYVSQDVPFTACVYLGLYQSKHAPCSESTTLSINYCQHMCYILLSAFLILSSLHLPL